MFLQKSQLWIFFDELHIYFLKNLVIMTELQNIK